jgi:adenylylsulfate kinase-like enzyme
MARCLFQEAEFMKVFVVAPLEVAGTRDPKGLYKKARKGALPNLTGVDSAFEKPKRPDIHLRTDSITIQDAINTLLENLDLR